MHITKRVKPIWKDHIVYSSKYLTFWKRQNYGDIKKINGCQGLGREKDESEKHRGFLKQWEHYVWCYDRWYTHTTFGQAHSMYNTKSEPQCKLWTLGDYDASVQVHQRNKCTTLMGDVANREAGHMWGQGVHEKCLYLPLNFAVNLKVLSKNKVHFKNKNNFSSCREWEQSSGRTTIWGILECKNNASEISDSVLLSQSWWLCSNKPSLCPSVHRSRFMLSEFRELSA